MKESGAAFMADLEWQDIKKAWAAEHGQAVAEIKEKVLVTTDHIHAP